MKNRITQPEVSPRRRKKALLVLLASILLLVSLPFLMVACALVQNGVPLLSEPGLRARLNTYLTTRVAETREGHVFPELEPRTWEIPRDRLRERVLGAIQELGWEEVSADTDSEEIRAVASTPLFRFKDDVTIHLEETAGGGTRLIVRSESRVGKGDLGANARHIFDLYRMVDKVLSD